MVFNKILVACFIFIFTTLLISQVTANPYTIPAPKIAIVDIQSILRDSLSSKEARKKMDAIYESIRLCTVCSKEITDRLPKPHNLEFEKCIYPFILLSKKWNS